MSAKALGERGTENDLEGQAGFGEVKQKGKGVPGGTVVGEYWACTRSTPTVKEQQESRPNRGVEPGNRGFGRRLRNVEFFSGGSGAMQLGGEERRRVELSEGSCGDHLAWFRVRTVLSVQETLAPGKAPSICQVLLRRGSSLAQGDSRVPSLFSCGSRPLLRCSRRTRR